MKTLKDCITEGLFGGSKHKAPRTTFDGLAIGDKIYGRYCGSHDIYEVHIKDFFVSTINGAKFLTFEPDPKDGLEFNINIPYHLRDTESYCNVVTSWIFATNKEELK